MDKITQESIGNCNISTIRREHAAPIIFVMLITFSDFTPIPKLPTHQKPESFYLKRLRSKNILGNRFDPSWFKRDKKSPI